MQDDGTYAPAGRNRRERRKAALVAKKHKGENVDTASATVTSDKLAKTNGTDSAKSNSSVGGLPSAGDKVAMSDDELKSAIKHLHEHNIVHRDLKPENCLMESKAQNSEIKLIDFGLSKRWSTEAGAAKMHTVVGTPYYVAPEVLRGEYDKMCDIWSLGIILYVFLCGYPPFEGDNNKEIFKNVLKSKLEFDPADWDTVSDEAKDLVSKML